MSTPKPCYVIEFGARRVAFYPLLLKHVREAAAPAAEAERTPAAAYESLMRQFLLSAQRGDPGVTMDDVEAVVDLSNRDALVQAITGRAAAPAETAEATPTRPLNGGASTGTSSPLPGGLTQ